MALIDIPQDATPEAEKLAKGFLAEQNQEFEAQRQRAYDVIQRFWYRNQDAENNPSLTGNEPTGIEILQAMGTRAESTMQAAYLRAMLLVDVATLYGKMGEVDLTKIANPYNLTFNIDGSLNTYEIKA